MTYFDKKVNKLISRKFLAWAVATIAMFSGVLNGVEWTTVTGIYLGVQGWLDYLKSKGNSSFLNDVQ